MAEQANLAAAGVAVARRRVAEGSRRRAAAQPDEDAITLAVEAAAAALPEALARPAGLIFASTTPPYARGGSVQVLAELLGIQGPSFALELSASARDGLSALRLGTAMTRAGEGPVLICAAHAPDPGEWREGAAAVAVLVDAASERSLGTIAPAVSLVEELRDNWQLGHADPVRVADRSFVAEIGTDRLARLAIDSSGPAPLRALVSGPDPRAAAAVERSHGGPGDEVAGALGSLGTAHPLMRMLLGLDRDSLVVAIANGLVEGIEVRPGEGAPEAVAAARAALDGGEEGAVPAPRLRPEDFAPYSSAPRSWRERDADLRLAGIVADDDERPVPGRSAPTGSVVTWVRDHVYPAAPVTDMAVVQLDGGGRHFGQVAAGEEVGIGDRVQLLPRRLHEGGDVVQYFWKVAPCR
jgi:hypothetical protein